MEATSERRTSLLNERVESPGQGFHGSLNPLAPSTKKSFLDLRQKIFRPPAPLVAVCAQGFVIFREASDQGFHGFEFRLDGADPREERGLRFGLGRRRCVRHGWMMARKGYRTPKFAGSTGWLTALWWIVRFLTVRRGFQHAWAGLSFGGTWRLLAAPHRQLGKARGDLLSQREAAQSDLRRKTVDNSNELMVLQERIELSTSPLPRV